MAFRFQAVLAALAFPCFAAAELSSDSNDSLASEPGLASIKVLSESDAALYEQIFTLQEEGRWSEADKKIAALEDNVLLGYVQYQRYMHPTAYRSQFSELKRWMSYYADHPEADKIYSLARKRRPSGQSNPIRPVPRKWKTQASKELHPGLVADYQQTGKPRLNRIEGRVRYLSNRSRAIEALREIENHAKRGAITGRQFDRMRSWIAASLYYQGYVDTAETIAKEAAARNGQSAVLAYWIAGLIDFRNGHIAASYEHFSSMAAVPYQEDSLRAAAGFWAARTALAAGHPADVTPNLEIAASFPFTFYGQLALAQLGRDYDYNWKTPALTQAELTALVNDQPRVKRAIALAEAGQEQLADVELRWASGSVDDDKTADLLAVAMMLGLPAAQIDIALSGQGRELEAGLFPVPHFMPESGFKVDRALLYALMRQESKFKTDATSRVGARGLMQLMPRTASFISGDRSLRYRSGREKLYDPSFNMELGQNYVDHLMTRAVDGDVFHLAAAYNGGPGNLRRWKRAVDIEDPLLFIESIPNRESRDFVEKVLTNFWVYRARLGQPAPTREKVAAGELPLYEALDRIAEQTD
ncbi:lytic transglycosylase domain-containing protein [Hyphococcus flavus]|uniref:Lytic transglycosylase domain-containing protein n=1 Tax=Hyphococcus flavus TaxID=1866326 RepID=A0AAE9ZDU7_9PROT|nr:lytic transglycosylase domain-containing protein [Hyphococcus flavus]WDI33204.1 lytic transglycosylase domain-containing protein [Hyphococcus flavus]